MTHILNLERILYSEKQEEYGVLDKYAKIYVYN